MIWYILILSSWHSPLVSAHLSCIQIQIQIQIHTSWYYATASTLYSLLPKTWEHHHICRPSHLQSYLTSLLLLLILLCVPATNSDYIYNNDHLSLRRRKQKSCFLSLFRPIRSLRQRYDRHLITGIGLDSVPCQVNLPNLVASLDTIALQLHKIGHLMCWQIE